MVSRRQDNTIRTARNLGTLSGTRAIRDAVSRSDQFDFYRFTLNSSSKFSIAVRPSQSAVNVRTFNARGGTIAQFNQPKGARGRIVEQELAAGQYFVRIGRRGGATAYRMTLGSSAIVPPAPPPVPIPPSIPVPPSVPVPPPAGDTLATAFDIGALTGTATRTGALNTTNTIDFYRLTLGQITNFEARLSSPGSTRLELIFDANGNNLVDQGEIIRSDSDFGAGVSAITEPLPVGAYFLGVRSGSSSVATTYDLTLVATPNPGNLSSLPGNTLPTAFNLGNLDQLPAGTFLAKDYVGVVGNQDFYRFALSQNSKLELRLNASISTELDLIFDANGNGLVDQTEVVKNSRTFSAGANSLAEPLPAGTYFAGVSPASSSASTVYDLTLVATADPGTVSPPPGNRLPTAFNLGTLDQLPSRTYLAKDYVGILGEQDVYRFSLSQSRSVEFKLDSSISTEIDLVSDINGNGLVDQNEIVRNSRTFSAGTNSLTSALAAGTYFARVRPASSSSSTLYSLSLIAT